MSVPSPQQSLQQALDALPPLILAAEFCSHLASLFPDRFSESAGLPVIMAEYRRFVAGREHLAEDLYSRGQEAAALFARDGVPKSVSNSLAAYWIGAEEVALFGEHLGVLDTSDALKFLQKTETALLKLGQSQLDRDAAKAYHRGRLFLLPFDHSIASGGSR